MLVRSLTAGAVEARETWALSHLKNRDPRFPQAWAVASGVPGWFKESVAAGMFVALAEISPKRIVEIGSYLGRSTVFFAKAMDTLGCDGEVVAIDPHTGDRQNKAKLGVEGDLSSLKLFRDHLAAVRVTDRVRPIVAGSDDAAVGWSDPIDFLFVDGWHSYEAVYQDGTNWTPFVAGNGAIVFDDTGNYPELARAVDDLAAAGVLAKWAQVAGQTWCGPPGSKRPSYMDFVVSCYRPVPRRHKAGVR